MLNQPGCCMPFTFLCSPSLGVKFWQRNAHFLLACACWTFISQNKRSKFVNKIVICVVPPYNNKESRMNHYTRRRRRRISDYWMPISFHTKWKASQHISAYKNGNKDGLKHSKPLWVFCWLPIFPRFLTEPPLMIELWVRVVFFPSLEGRTVNL